MLYRPLIDAVKTVVLLSIFCVCTVRSNLIARADESSLSLRLIDVETKISPIPIIFLNKKSSVVVEGLEWLIETNGNSQLIYSTFINERQVANGTVELSDTWNKNSTAGIPLSIDVGVIEANDAGSNSIRVVLYSVLNGDIIQSSATLNVRSYQQWMASIPIILAFGLFLIFKVHMIHSLFLAMIIGSCIVEGSMIDGFSAVLNTYLLQAATDSAHASM